MADHIQFADEIKPVKSRDDESGVGGIYNLRERRSRTRSVSRSSARDRIHAHDNVPEEDEDPGLRNEGDYKSVQVFSKKELLLLAYGSVGVIYGDIGTSPLYVYSSTFAAPPSHDDLLGALSLIMWSLIMMVTVKYVLVILHADNEGEGGTFSTYALISRYANISNRDPREASLVRMKRYSSGELGSAGGKMRGTIEGSTFLRWCLKIMGVLSVSMILSDGVLTPAQSVLGAVQGLDVAVKDISKSTIIGTTCAILILLFLIQPFGVGRISFVFAPIIMIWLAFNAVFGIYNLAHHDYSVLKGFNPAYAFKYLIRTGEHGWRSLGGILLSFTGVEAMFADLGAFSRQAIQLSWLLYVFPCLLLAYIGQAAFISDFPEAYDNPFYKSVPGGMLIPSLIIGILAAIVASQAIITATFQLLSQIMKLSYFPQIQVKHTSKHHFGQVFVGPVNWLLMVGTVLVAAIYNNTTSLGNAYGVCVMFVTFFDTCMVTLAAIIVWKVNPFLVFLPWLAIACMDGTFLSSALTKVPDGAWFTITLAIILASIFMLWRFGKESQWSAEAEDRFPTTHFVHRSEDDTLALTSKYGGTELSRMAGLGIYFDKAGETTPIVFSQFIRKLTTIPEVMVFFHLRALEMPSVPPERRYTVSRLAIPNCYRLIVRHGYLDEIVSPDLAGLVYEKLRDHIVRRAVDDYTITGTATGTDNHVNADTQDDETIKNPDTANLNIESTSTIPVKTSHGLRHLSVDGEKAIAAENEAVSISLRVLERAYSHQTLYIIGKESMRIKPKTNVVRQVLLQLFLFMRENTRNKIASLNVQGDQVIEVGFVKDV